METNRPSIRRWAADTHPDPKRIDARMKAEGVPHYRWSNGPGDVYAAHHHDYHKVIYVVQGSIVFGLPELDEQVELVAGDRLDLPAGLVHDAVVGSQGVVCLEAHRPISKR